MAHRVLIVGGGFGGLWAARGLANADVEITLVDRSNHHLFQPLLYQVATAGLSAPAIAAPLRHLLRKQGNLAVLLGNVTQVDVARRTLTFDDTTLSYDTLVLAPGATHAYFGHDEWADAAPGLKTLGDALDIRRRVLMAFERAELETDPQRAKEWLHFAVIGGGPTGVELAGTLAEIARHTLRREFRRIDPTQAKVDLIEAGPRVLSAFDPALSEKAKRALEHLGVDVRLGRAVTHIDANGFDLGDERVAARTVLWAAGVAASALGQQLGVPLDRAGRVLVAPDMTVPGHPEIFVIGDLASIACDGKPVPGVAPAAKQMGRYVAKVIRERVTNTKALDPGVRRDDARVVGSASEPFRYIDQGSLATIGRMAAVVEYKKLKLSGVIAWWIWLAGHIFFLIGFRNRLVVLTDWAWSYFSYRRYARIISDPIDPPSEA